MTTSTKPQRGATITMHNVGATSLAAGRAALASLGVTIDGRPGIGVQIYELGQAQWGGEWDEDGVQIVAPTQGTGVRFLITADETRIAAMQAAGESLTTTPAAALGYFQTNGTPQTIDGAAALRIGDVWLWTEVPPGAVSVMGAQQ